MRGRSFSELRVRSKQLLAIYAEQAGWPSLVRLPSSSEFTNQAGNEKNEDSVRGNNLLNAFRARIQNSFFSSFASPETTLAELDRLFGEEQRSAVCAHANRILSGRFDLLGLRDLDFGSPIDWHLEPVSKIRSPLHHWSRIDYLNARVVGDKKIIWELNRHQYFVVLGQAYWYTRDEKYAQAFVTHLTSWITANPPKLGINWASSLELAFRSISWLWALCFFKDSPHLTADVFLLTCKMLFLHGRHLETHLSVYFSPNTHLTGEALGLYYLGTLFPEFRRAARWRETGSGILEESIESQVKPDGVYFEQASYYHKYTVDFYLHYLLLANVNNHQTKPQVQEKLTKLLDHLMLITRPDGTTPFFGDDDGGQLMLLEQRAPNDFRGTLATGAALFQRPDYKFIAGKVSPGTVWLMGKGGSNNFENLRSIPPAQLSQAFTDGGYYVMRDGWTQKSNYLLADCGPHGALNCGHAHADALSFELAPLGRTLLIDPGTHTYTGQTEQRNRFRSSQMHNTLTIDGQSSSEPGGAFTWKTKAQSSAQQWISAQRFDFLAGAHDGYLRLTSPVITTRKIFFLKNNYWVIHDRVETTGRHLYDFSYHYSADARPAIAQSQDTEYVLETATEETSGLQVFSFGGNGKWRYEEGEISPVYAALQKAPVWVYRAEALGNQDFVTFLVPRSSQQVPARVRAIDAAGENVFEFSDWQNHDFLIHAGREVTCERITFDGDWLWLRFDAHTNRLMEYVAINARRLEVDQIELFNARNGFSFLAASYSGKALVVETSTTDNLALSTQGINTITINGVVRPMKEQHREDVILIAD